MTLLRIAVLLFMAGLSTGCLRLTYTLNLKPDGSGTIVQTVAMSKAALTSAMGALSAAFEVKDAPGATGPIPFLTEEELKKAATAMGGGVRFVGLAPVADQTLEGQTATFAFDDIRKLPLNFAAMLAGGFGEKLGSKEIPGEDKIGVTFARENGRSILVLDLPVIEEAEAKDRLDKLKRESPGEKPEAAPDVPPEFAKMMQDMLAGFFIEVALNIEGTIVSTDAPFVDGGKIVLMQMDIGELMKTAKGLDELMEKLEAVPDDLVKMFEMPGLKVVTARKIRIEFR